MVGRALGIVRILKIFPSKEAYSQHIVEEANTLSYKYSLTSDVASIALTKVQKDN